MPAPAVSGAMVRCRAVSSSSGASITGQMCSQTWFMSSRAPFGPRAVRARRIASRQFGDARSACGSETRGRLRRARRRARAPGRGPRGAGRPSLSRRDAVVEQHVLRRVEPGDPEVAQPPQVEPAADHRVHTAHQVVLDDAVRPGPEGEVGDRAGRCPGTRRPPRGARRRANGTRRGARASSCRGLVRRLRRIRPAPGRGRRPLRGPAAPGRAGGDAREAAGSRRVRPARRCARAVVTRRVGRSSSV